MCSGPNHHNRHRCNVAHRISIVSGCKHGGGVKRIRRGAGRQRGRVNVKRIGHCNKIKEGNIVQVIGYWYVGVDLGVMTFIELKGSNDNGLIASAKWECTACKMNDVACV